MAHKLPLFNQDKYVLEIDTINTHKIDIHKEKVIQQLNK